MSSFVRSHLQQFSSCSGVELLSGDHIIAGVEYQAPSCSSSSCLGRLVVEERCTFVIKMSSQSPAEDTKVKLAVRYAVKKSGSNDTAYDIKTHGLQIGLVDRANPSVANNIAEYSQASLNQVKAFYVDLEGKHHPACVATLLPTSVAAPLTDNSSKELEQKNSIVPSLVKTKNHNDIVNAVMSFLGHKNGCTAENTVVSLGRGKQHDGNPAHASGIVCSVKCAASVKTDICSRSISIEYSVDITDRKFLSLQIRPSRVGAPDHSKLGQHSAGCSQGGGKPVAYWETLNTIACTTALLQDLEGLYKHQRDAISSQVELYA